jgi:transposase
MATGLIDDELWKLIEPLLPVRKRRFHHPGRKRLDDHRTLAGILLVLRTGIAWQQLPEELGYGSGMTCWRRPQGMATGRRVPRTARTPARQAPRRRAPRSLHSGLRLRLAAVALGARRSVLAPLIGANLAASTT